MGYQNTNFPGNTQSWVHLSHCLKTHFDVRSKFGHLHLTKSFCRISWRTLPLSGCSSIDYCTWASPTWVTWFTWVTWHDGSLWSHAKNIFQPFFTFFLKWKKLLVRISCTGYQQINQIESYQTLVSIDSRLHLKIMIERSMSQELKLTTRYRCSIIDVLSIAVWIFSRRSFVVP